MGKRVKCPVCGMLVWESQVLRSHEIEVKEMHRKKHSKKGWIYVPIFDQGLVDLVKNKIKSLYERFFPEGTVQLKISPGLTPRPSLFARPSLVPRAELGLNSLIIKSSEVKMVG